MELLLRFDERAYKKLRSEVTTLILCDKCDTLSEQLARLIIEAIDKGATVKEIKLKQRGSDNV